MIHTTTAARRKASRSRMDRFARRSSIERLENGVEIQILPGPFIQELTRPSIFDA